MSILTDAPPGRIRVGGANYNVSWRFDECIKVLGLMETGASQDYSTAVAMFYCNNIPRNSQEAINRMGWFLACGDTSRIAVDKGKTTGKPLDYDVDANLIYAAFRSEYALDLHAEKLHWWTFRALLNGLGEEQRISKIIGYRTMDLSKIKDKTMRKQYAKLKKQYSLSNIKRTKQKLPPRGMAAQIGGIM